MKLLKLNLKLTAAFILPAALTLASCSEESEDPTKGDNKSTVKLVPMTIGAEILQPISRAVFENGKYISDGNYEADAIAWEKDDEISVYFVGDKENTLQPFTIGGFDKDGNATLNGKGPAEGTYNVYAVYPAVPAGTNMSSISFTINNKQQQEGNELIIDDNALMWGKSAGAVNLPEDALNLEFEHKAALLRFNILNSLEENITITNVKLEYSGTASNLNTKVSMNSITGTLSGYSIQHAHDVSIESGGPIEKNKTFDAYMLILPSSLVATDDASTDLYKVTISYKLPENNDETHHAVIYRERLFNSKAALASSSRTLFEMEIPMIDKDVFTPTSDFLPYGIVLGDYKIDESTKVPVLAYPHPNGGSSVYFSAEFCMVTDGVDGTVEVRENVNLYTKEQALQACKPPYRLPRISDINTGIGRFTIEQRFFIYDHIGLLTDDGRYIRSTGVTNFWLLDTAMEFGQVLMAVGEVRQHEASGVVLDASFFGVDYWMGNLHVPVICIIAQD